jgi:hypothetical protein
MRYHKIKSPQDLVCGEEKITALLNPLAVEKAVATSTQNRP